MTVPTLTDALYFARVAAGFACAIGALWVAIGPVVRRLALGRRSPSDPATSADVSAAASPPVRTSRAA